MALRGLATRLTSTRFPGNLPFGFKTKLVGSFIIVVGVTGFFSVLVGVRFIGDGFIRETQARVANDLNSARYMYERELEGVKSAIRLTARRFFIRESLTQNDIEWLTKELRKIRLEENLDILVLLDAEGRVIVRTRNPGVKNDSQMGSPIVRKVLWTGEPVAGTEIVRRDELVKEGLDLAERARIVLVPTPKARPTRDLERSSGMVLKAAAPVLDAKGKLIGILCGARLLNRNFSLVDSIKATLYQNMTFKGKDVGTTTIFQKDLRIATNVRGTDGARAVGTRVSDEVYERVLLRGERWIDRAFVVNDWYIAAYEPIRNMDGGVEGILYVGVLEERFASLRRRAVLVFHGIALLGMLLAVGLAVALAGGVSRPVRELASVAQDLARGDMHKRVELESRDEIGRLGESFNIMADAIQERDEKLKLRAQQVVARSERLAMIGQLAAGVAHEINNPLGGIMVYSHLLLEDPEIKGSAHGNVQAIANEAARCRAIVKGLLDFARQSKPERLQTDVNSLIKATLSLVERQPLFKEIERELSLAPDLPRLWVDPMQIQQVFMNIFINAAEAMQGKGRLFVRTALLENGRDVEIAISDTGCGISKRNLERLFEPFFTTKEVGKGTGLGLAISHGIVAQHQGGIEVKSEPDEGATFTIRLPVERRASA